jgi:hypothetical protein
VASRPKQEAMRERLSVLEPSEWHVPADRSEQTTLAFMVKRGLVEAIFSDGRCVYRLAHPEIDLGTFGADVVSLDGARG